MNIRENTDSPTFRKLNILYQISKYVSSTLDLSKILKTILTGVTFGNGFGYNRAYLFLAEKSDQYLAGRLAVGPDNAQDAANIWQQIQEKNFSLEDFLTRNSKHQYDHYYSQLDQRVRNIKIPVDSRKLVAKSYQDNEIINVDLTAPGFDREQIESEILTLIDYEKFCLIPLASFNRRLGVMIVDNKYNHREITADDISFLYMLSQQAAQAIENASAYRDLKDIVSRLVKVNEKINYLKEYNENILENIPIGICVVDNKFDINACNSSFCLMAGKEKQQLMGMHISWVHLQIRGRNIKRILKKVKNAAKNRSLSRAAMDFGQGGRICNLNLSMLKDMKGRIDGIIIIIDDITEQVNMEETMEELKRLAQLGEFAAHVAHEIRNPLAAIGGYARRLKKGHLAGRGADMESMDIIIQEVERLENIVNSTLQYSQDKREVLAEDISLEQVLGECIQVIEAYAEDRQITINQSLVESGVRVRGSREKLKQAFINLVKNSIEASYIGEKINIRLEKAADKAVIRIDNRGSIIEKEDIEKIFLPFYSTKKGGTGLGLAITKKIITEHQGQIDVCSKKDNTIFTIKLPVAGGENENHTDR
ncbi:MAG: PAS domain-containing protein [Actinomycetia bacterium]|nr:PAS domain-containing protein [Actinomycetes bacterium]